MGSFRAIEVNESDPLLKSSLLYETPKDEELVDLTRRLGLTLVLLPLSDLLSVDFVVVENLVDLLDHVHLCALLI